MAKSRSRTKAKAKTKASGKKVKAFFSVVLFESDEEKVGTSEGKKKAKARREARTKTVRDALKGKKMVRKKKGGTVIVDNEIDTSLGDKGRPPKRAKKKGKHVTKKRDPKVELDRVIAGLPEEVRPKKKKKKDEKK